MKVFELYGKLDAWLIRKATELYLWLLDWTGVYLGTVVFAIMMAPPAFFAAFRDKDTFDHVTTVIMVACAIIGGLQRNHLQRKSDYAMLNRIAEMMEGSYARHAFIAFNVSTMLIDTVIGRYGNAALADFPQAIMWYVFCVRVRERKPKEFFAPKLAHQRSS